MSTATRIDIPRVTGPVKDHSYIVKLKQGTDKKEHLEYVDTHIRRRVGGECEVTHSEWDPEFFNGYAGKFTGAALDAVCHLTDIEYIEVDKIGSVEAVVNQTNAPWGLARLSQDKRVIGNSTDLNFTYKYDSSAGQGVDVYIIDTGVYVEHNDFGRRAILGPNFVPGSPNVDDNGHGTHCAGIAIGTQFGAAKAARVISVKAFNAQGKGTISDSISSIGWSANNGHHSERPFVISMSFIFEYSQALNEAVNTVTLSGAHTVAGAGNDNIDAKDWSPASAAAAITVGASNIDDARTWFSNYGPVVDIFAPGQTITSCGTAGPSSIAVKSGTSMSTPYVAGLVAYLIGRSGNIQPAAMKARLLDLSVRNVITGIPQGTPNALARNDQ